MTIVNSWNEWDQLRHVIVGIADKANIPPMEPALEPKISEIRPGANLANTKLSDANLSGANLIRVDLGDADLFDANLSGISATNHRGCPRFLPSGWVCENNTLIQR